MSDENAVVTRKQFTEKAMLIAREFAGALREMGARLNAVEKRAEPEDARHAERIAALEARVGALSMMLTNNAGGAVARERMRMLETVEKRLADLEAQPRLAYEGVWREGVSYEQGSLVTRSGSMWHANKATREKPGTCDDWTLCVKDGRRG